MHVCMSGLLLISNILFSVCCRNQDDLVNGNWDNLVIKQNFGLLLTLTPFSLSFFK